MNDIVKPKTPKIFIVLGEIVKRSSWLGYISLAGIIAVSAVIFYADYKIILDQGFKKILGYLVTVAILAAMSLGFVKFAKKYGEAIRAGKRSAIIGVLLAAVLISIITALMATVFRNWGNRAEYQITSWVCIVTAAFILTFSLNLIVYWKDLKGGLEIYEE